MLPHQTILPPPRWPRSSGSLALYVARLPANTFRFYIQPNKCKPVRNVSFHHHIFLNLYSVKVVKFWKLYAVHILRMLHLSFVRYKRLYCRFIKEVSYIQDKGTSLYPQLVLLLFFLLRSGGTLPPMVFLRLDVGRVGAWDTFGAARNRGEVWKGRERGAGRKRRDIKFSTADSAAPERTLGMADPSPPQLLVRLYPRAVLSQPEAEMLFFPSKSPLY